MGGLPVARSTALHRVVKCVAGKPCGCTETWVLESRRNCNRWKLPSTRTVQALVTNTVPPRLLSALCLALRSSVLQILAGKMGGL